MSEQVHCRLTIEIYLLTFNKLRKCGATTFIVCVVAGQMLASLLIDHYGLMGLAQRLATPGRIAGVALIFAGMIVVQWQTPAPCVPAATGDAAAAQPEPQR